MLKKGYLFIVAAAVLLAVSCEEPAEPAEEEPTLYPTEGAINARYTVAEGRTVVFAKGNLQYQASTRTWRFANSQYDYIGAANSQADTHYAGWIDLFGWGTSGYCGLMPYCVDDTSEHYGNLEQPLTDIAYTSYDWGRFNTISNGGRQGSWRTLSYREWEYLLSYRTGANTKKGLATLVDIDERGDIAGLLLLPDSWTLPAGCEFHYGHANGFLTNSYTGEQWTLMELAGAVFLPAAGYRTGREVNLEGLYGGYWTSSYYYLTTASDLYFHDRMFGLSATDRSNGQAVRLVQTK